MGSAKPEDMTHSAKLSEAGNILDVIDREADSHDLRLLRASKNGWDDLVKTLLNQRDDLLCGRYEKRGHTPLTFAASNGHENVVRLLLEHGADVEKRNQSSASGPLSLKFSDQTPLTWAAGNGHSKVVKVLLEAGADPNGGERDDHLSPLAVAAVRGHEDTVCVLLEQADINFEQRGSRHDRTVLSHSAEDGQEAIVTRLLSKGADPNLHDSVGRSPLFFAAALGHTTIVNILLSHGADINQVDQKHSDIGHDSPGGRTALFHAADRGHGDVVQLLLQKGTDVNHLDWGGWTSLTRAIFRGHIAVVEVLLEHGANLERGKEILGIPVVKYVQWGLGGVNDPPRPGFDQIYQLLQKFCPESIPPSGFFQSLLAMWK